MKDWAYIVSLLLSPHLYGVIVLAIICAWKGYGPLAFLEAGALLSLAPLLPILVDRWRGKTDIFISERRKRTKYFAATAAIYAAAAGLYYLRGQTLLYLLFATYLVETLLHMAVNTRWKISIHSAGIAGPTTFLVLTLGACFAALYLLLLPVYAARKKLRAHTDAQLLAGALLAALSTVVVVKILTSYTA